MKIFLMPMNESINFTYSELWLRLTYLLCVNLLCVVSSMECAPIGVMDEGRRAGKHAPRLTYIFTMAVYSTIHCQVNDCSIRVLEC